jgi:hypothetical protein
MNITVSLITPSFNRENIYAETLDSIAAQTYPYWENIIVDDGSSDQTKKIVADYAARDPRFKAFDRIGTPKGASTCRNEGVSHSHGKYVMFLDTDDIIEPFCLEQRVRVMESCPDLDFAIFSCLMFEKVPHDLGLWWNIDKPKDELSRQFRQDAICQGTGVLWRKEAFERIGMWDPALMLWQDVDLFFRAYIKGYNYAKFFDLPPDLHYRVSSTSLSHGSFFSPAKTRSRLDVLKRAVNLLEQNGQPDRKREARFMCGEIVTGAARSNHFRLALSTLGWARQRGVLSSGEALSLGVATLMRATRLGRLPGMTCLLSRLDGRFLAESTLGRIPVDNKPEKFRPIS